MSRPRVAEKMVAPAGRALASRPGPVACYHPPTTFNYKNKRHHINEIIIAFIIDRVFLYPFLF